MTDESAPDTAERVELDVLPADSTDLPDSDRAGDLAKLDERLDGLTAAIDRLTERVRADQDVIGRMQSRIEALQGDQVRALLGPAVTELANLHTAFAESAERDYERLGFDRVRKEFDLLAGRIESAIDVLGAVSLEARVGDAFDSRLHNAVRQVPTGDAALDKTIAGILRQGFRFDSDRRPALYARVQVYSYDSTLAVPSVPSDPGPVRDVSVPDYSPVAQDDASFPDFFPASDPATEPDDELELPFPLRDQ